MTKKQFQKKIETARKTGSTYLGDGCTLHYLGDGWSIRHKDGNTVATCTHNPEEHFDFMID